MDCGCGLGAAELRFPSVERVLAGYIAGELRAGRAFYVSPDLNSEALAHVDPEQIEPMWPGPAGSEFGFLPALAAIFAAVVSTASSVGSAVLAAAPSIATVAGSVAAIKTANAANHQLQNNQIQVPSAIATPVVNAVKQDAGGFNLGNISQNTLLLMLGGGLLIFAMASGRR